jgi:periplasmic copper chaperone A
MNRNFSARGSFMAAALAITLAGAMAAPVAMAHHTPEHDAQQSAKVSVNQPFASPTMPGATVGAAYMQVVNRGRNQVVLVSATSPVSAKVEFHSMSMEGNIMRMREIKGGIPIPPGGSVNFVPGGMHIMLVGLTQRLAPGSAIPLTLTFNGAPQVSLQVPVQGPSGGHHHH